MGKIIELKRPYQFEGVEYTTIDLTGLQKLTMADVIEAQKQLTATGELAATYVLETSTAFAEELAAKAAGQPIEFFELLPIGAGRKVAKAVLEAITHKIEDDKSDTHVLSFAAPYVYKGMTYTEVDLARVSELTTMDAKTAENKMAEQGIVAMENTSNYYYMCLIASMATGKDTAFFTGLPLCEAIPLKNMINGGFFE